MSYAQREREMWVQNDEGLYIWWQESRMGLKRFCRTFSNELDELIARALGEPFDGDEVLHDR